MDKRVTFDLDRAFSLSDADKCYTLTEQHISALLQIFPQVTWQKRWHGSGGKSPDEIRAFFADLSYRLLSPSDCGGFPELGDCFNYPPYAPFITYNLYNPYLDPTFVPAGYLVNPYIAGGYPFYDQDDLIVDLLSFLFLQIGGTYLPETCRVLKSIRLATVK